METAGVLPKVVLSLHAKRAEQLLGHAQDDIDRRWRRYQRLAATPQQHPADHRS